MKQRNLVRHAPMPHFATTTCPPVVTSARTEWEDGHGWHDSCSLQESSGKAEFTHPGRRDMVWLCCLPLLHAAAF